MSIELREGSADRMESEVIVYFHQLIHCVLFKDHKFIQIWTRLQSAVKTMDDMLFVDFFDKQHVEYFQLNDRQINMI